MEPHYFTDDVVAEMLENIMKYKDNIDKSKVMPRVRWSKKSEEV